MTWTVTPSGVYLAQIRDGLDALVGTALQYEDTIDGAWSSIAAELAWQVDQACAALLSELTLDTASAVGVMARALDAGLVPRPATRSRYIVYATGTGTLPLGAIVQGGGPMGRAQWRVLDATHVVTPGSAVAIEAVDVGAVSLGFSAALSLVVPVVGLTTLTYDSGDGDAYQLGRAAETTSQLRARVRRTRARGAGPSGIRAAVLGLPWVVAVDVGRVGVDMSITVAPGPVGADQEDQLAEAIYSAIPGNAGTVGGDSVTLAADVNGDPLVIRYTTGAVETRARTIALTLDGTVSESDAIDAATAAVQAVYADLVPGETLYYLRLLGALDLPGVIGVATSTSDEAPANAANVLAASPLTITASL